MADRSWFEEYLYRRTKSAEQRRQLEQLEPPDPARRVNLLLRTVGMIVPALLAYGLGAFYFGVTGNDVGYWVARALAAAVCVASVAALSVRRDFVGAGAVTGVYIFDDGWLWFTVMPT